MYIYICIDHQESDKNYMLDLTQLGSSNFFEVSKASVWTVFFPTKQSSDVWFSVATPKFLTKSDSLFSGKNVRWIETNDSNLIAKRGWTWSQDCHSEIWNLIFWNHWMLCFQSLEQQRQRNTSVQSLNMSEASGISVASKGPFGRHGTILGIWFWSVRKCGCYPPTIPQHAIEWKIYGQEISRDDDNQLLIIWGILLSDKQYGQTQWILADTEPPLHCPR